MNNGYSRSQQRREAARKYAVQCMNARGEIECSECGGAVEEARGNRNAQELKREGIRKSTDPICNACQASWRYSHHQEPEMANADDLPVYCFTCGVALSFKESHKHREQGHDVGPAPMKNDCENARPYGISDRVKYRDRVGVVEHVLQKSEGMQLSLRFEDGNTSLVDADFVELINKADNAAHTDTCDFCGKDYQCNRIKHDVLKCPDCGGPSTMIKNADNAKCRCGHTYDQHEEDPKGIKGATGSMPCSKCSCSSYYPERLTVKNDQSDKSKCARCGASTGKDGSLGVEHGYDVYCVDCAVKKGYIDKKDVPGYENADPGPNDLFIYVGKVEQAGGRKRGDIVTIDGQRVKLLRRDSYVMDGWWVKPVDM